MSEETQQGLFLVLDMESGLADALIRRVTDMGQYHVFRPWNAKVDVAKELDSYKDILRGVIISGSGKNIHSDKHAPPSIPAEIFQVGAPILAICYGLQYLAHLQGIPIVRCWDESDPNKRTKKAAKHDKGEQGPVLFHRTETDSLLFRGLNSTFPVWMKHNWMAQSVPAGWTHTGFTDKCSAAAFECGNIYCLQFHPEPFNSLFGKIILQNFFTQVCKVRTPYF